MTIDILYNSHDSGLELYAVILSKSLSMYSSVSNAFIESSDIVDGAIPLMEGKFNSYKSEIDASAFATGSYIIRIYQRSVSIVDQDVLLHVSEFNWDSNLQREVDSLDSSYYLPELLSYDVDQAYILKVVPSSSNVSSNVFQINDKVKPKIKLTRGKAYRFDQSHVSNGSMGYSGSSHPMRISTSSDGVHKGGTAYNSGVVYSKNTGHIRSYIVFEVPSNAPSKLYYYCHNHPNMGGVIDIIGGNINDFGNNTIEVISTRGAASSNEVRVIAR